MSNDFRSDPMDSPEGKGRARRAWDAYANAANRVAAPVMNPLAAGIARKQVIELVGFWVAWHLYGGFEGLVDAVYVYPDHLRVVACGAPPLKVDLTEVGLRPPTGMGPLVSEGGLEPPRPNGH